MNVIIAYLETMFGAYPQTPRMLEAKAELQTMMEDAYSGFIAQGMSENEAVGRVITEFGNLDELAPALGIADELHPGAPAPGSGSPSAPSSSTLIHPPITMDEALGFAEAQRRTRFRLGAAVALFVLSPIALITLSTAAGLERIPLSSGGASALGIGALLLLVASGVILILSVSRAFTPFSRVNEGRFSPDPAVSAWADALAQQHESRRISALQIAILLWVFSPAPIIGLSLLTQDSPQNDFWSTLGVGLMLLLVATGLFILLTASWARSAAEKLGSTASRRSRQEEREESSLVGIVARIYWPLVTAIFLAWSFIGNAWGRSWIVWPIAGVFFAVVVGVLGAVRASRGSQR